MTITFISTKQITALTMAGNGATLVSAVTALNANQSVSYIYRATGTSWYPFSTQIAVPFPQSMVRLNTANGFGSTNTVIKRYSTTVTNQGSDITYADSATLGASFTINTTGVYGIAISVTGTTTNQGGISLNSTQLTTTISSITAANRLVSSSSYLGNAFSASVTVYLTAGDVIRPHCDTTATSNAALENFTITRVS
jgi:hypothetical protein